VTYTLQNLASAESRSEEALFKFVKESPLFVEKGSSPHSTSGTCRHRAAPLAARAPLQSGLGYNPRIPPTLILVTPRFVFLVFVLGGEAGNLGKLIDWDMTKRPRTKPAHAANNMPRKRASARAQRQSFDFPRAADRYTACVGCCFVLFCRSHCFTSLTPLFRML
jgi:hypothetical protein